MSGMAGILLLLSRSTKVEGAVPTRRSSSIQSVSARQDVGEWEKRAQAQRFSKDEA